MSFNRNTQHILVLHERKTLFVQGAILENKTADSTTKALFGLMTSIPKAARKTLTLDNGGEFADHEKYQEVGLEAYVMLSILQQRARSRQPVQYLVIA